MKTIQQTKLAFREGTSDKVYEVSITYANGEYSVHFAFGRRGSVLNPGVKENTRSLPYAQSVFNELVRSKIKKGYREVSVAVAPKPVAAVTVQPLPSVDF